MSIEKQLDNKNFNVNEEKDFLLDNRQITYKYSFTVEKNQSYFFGVYIQIFFFLLFFLLILFQKL